jgi:ABC-2 type transport system permease protein
VAGKLFPYALIGVVDLVLVLAVAIFWFEVPARGSVLLLFALSFFYILNTLALGLLVSTVSKTQQQAMMTAAFFVMMPMVYLSGFIFPIENMPAAIQPVTYLVPVRYYLVIVRGILLKGVGLDVLWPDAAALLAIGTGLLVLATLRSRKTVR